MSYTKTNWSNNVAPALSATNLNKIEQGIYDAHDKLDGINDTVTDVVFTTNPITGKSVLQKTIKDNDTGESNVTNMNIPDNDTRYTFDTQNSSRGEFRVSPSNQSAEPYQVMIKDGDKLADKDVVAELGAHNLVNITIQSQTIGGIAVTNNGDGTVTVNGTNSSGNNLYIKLCDVVIKSGVYFLSGCPEGGETGKCLQFNSIQPYIAPIQDKGNGAYFNTSNQATQTVPLYIAVWKNVTIDNWTFKPMVSYYYASRDFHPYAMTNRDITDALSYSTTERVVGYWLDGKPIYQKTKEVSLNMSGGQTYEEDLSHFASDIKRVIDLKGTFYRSGRTLPLPSMVTDTAEAIKAYANNLYISEDNKITIRVGDNDALYGSFAYTLQYTKTTD